MRRVIRGVAIALAVIAVAGGGLAFKYLSHPSLAPYASLALAPSSPRSSGLRATYLGVTTILLDDGETAIMTDGFLSRPGKWSLLFGEIAPDSARIDAVLRHAGVSTLAAVMVAHSHFDHALDAPVVALKTGAVLIGSTSTANIARGAGFPEPRLRIITGGETFMFGRFKVTVFKSPHSPDAVYEGDIAEPLAAPAKSSAYREGGNYSFLVEHDGRAVLIHASANFTPDLYKDVHADVVFLGIGRLGRQSDEFARDYWREVVQRTGATLVIPIHWDDFTLPLDQPLAPMPALMDNFGRAMELVLQSAAREHVTVGLMPLFTPVDLSALVPAPAAG